MSTTAFGFLITTIESQPYRFYVQGIASEGGKSDSLNQIRYIYHFEEQKGTISFVVKVSSLLIDTRFTDQEILQHDSSLRYGLWSIRSKSSEREFILTTDEYDRYVARATLAGQELRTSILEFFYNTYRVSPQQGMSVFDLEDNFPATHSDLQDWLMSLYEAEYIVRCKTSAKYREGRRPIGATPYRLNPKNGKLIAAELQEVNRSESTLIESVSSEYRTYGIHKFDVALSFAGEQRDYVEQVAECLKEQGLSVFYDKNEEVDMWGKDLAEYFDSAFRKQSRFVVMFISKDYASKMWTNHERKSALSRQITQNGEYILPVRFDKTDLPGIPPTLGYVSAAEKAPNQLAQMVIAKVRTS